MQVASYDGWIQNQELVLQFYNDRRNQLQGAQPNEGHTGLVELEEFFDVHIITQNVDDLHERAGSKNVLHLHGQLTKARSTGNETLVYDIGYNSITPGDNCEEGHQLRPHIVWFGEPVPAMEEAVSIASTADIFVVIGTSLVVYPAASLIDYIPRDIPIYLVDPNEVNAPGYRPVTFIKEKASTGVRTLMKKLITKKK